MKVCITFDINEGKIENVVTKILEEVEPEKKVVNTGISDYARFFDEGCVGWQKNAEYNLMFLKQIQSWANDMLRAKGHLFLNEVYDKLGIPRSKAGQIVGWVYDENNPLSDNYVDFDLYSERNQDFVNGYRDTALLDFNVMGNILELV